MRTPHPLKRANKAQVAEFFEVSVKTVDAWIRRGCPVLERGHKSRAWVLDCGAVLKWYFERQHAGVPPEDPQDMSPQDRRAWYESEVRRRALLKMDSELIPVADVERIVSIAYAEIAAALRGLPSAIQRRYSLSDEVTEKIAESVRLEMDGLQDNLSELGTFPAEIGGISDS